MKKVVIDKGPLTGGHAVRGIGVHTKELLKAIKDLKNKEIEVDAIDFSSSDLSNYDLVHFPYFHPYFRTLHLKKGMKTIVTIHDLIPLIYPKAYPPGLQGKMNFLIQKYMAKRADAILTISETSKKDIVRFLGVDQDKIYVVHLAPKNIFSNKVKERELDRVRKKYKLPKTFVLYVGDVNYNKNIPTLIKASKIAKTPLIIVGKQAMDIENQGLGLPSIEGPRDWIRFLLDIPHPELAHYSAILDAFRKSKNIKRVGFIPDKDLVAIYNLAAVYCQPSYYEGFGLPLLEAFACGTPVVASKIQAHKEVADDACIYTDPENENEMATKIKKLIDDKALRKDFAKKGLKKVKEYSWKKTAQGTIKLYEEVLERV
jgi:glycosyltransferase involved in cell wall biosynthesis